MPNLKVLNPAPLPVPLNLGHHTSLTLREREVLDLRAGRTHAPLSRSDTAKVLRISRTRVKHVENQLCRKTLAALFERVVAESAGAVVDSEGYEASAAE